jgi:hypothetical protein
MKVIENGKGTFTAEWKIRLHYPIILVSVLGAGVERLNHHSHQTHMRKDSGTPSFLTS